VDRSALTNVTVGQSVNGGRLGKREIVGKEAAAAICAGLESFRHGLGNQDSFVVSRNQLG
jgi:hypothetical protein